MEHAEHSQRLIPLLSAMTGPEWLDELWIKRCRNEGDAVVLCWAKRTRRGMTLRGAAEEMEMSASHLSNILSGKKYLPHDFRIKFQRLCGNYAIRQYEDMACGFRTCPDDPQTREIRQLKSENERLKREAA